MADRQIETFVQIDGEDIHAGDLWSHRRRGRESATFSYRRDYLARADAYALDPALPLRDGQLQTAAGRELFGAFTDCAPDRWGRKLIERAERRSAGEEDRAPRSFGAIDYLLGGRDDLRQGALRFREAGGTAFLAEEDSGIPALIGLPKLLRSSERVERDEADDDDIRTLLKGGSSLGGARPKAHVVDLAGKPAIAKFPSPSSDGWDVMRWEATALDLARAGGIRVPLSRLIEVRGRAVLIVDRFDRRGSRRIGYASAMTMLEASDGESGSYLEIAEVIEAESAAASEDLTELWRRIAFSILISNTDDHLRNHGFLRLSTAGWSLSPAFDLNPDPEREVKYLNTSIDYDRSEARIETLMEVADSFGLDPARARATLGEVSAATAEWRRVAASHGLDAAAVAEMAPAFEHEQRQAARVESARSSSSATS